MYLQHLYPAPREYQKGQGAYRFGAEATACCTALGREQAERLRTLWHRFCHTGSGLTLQESGETGFSLHLGEAAVALRPEDRYALKATETGVALTARDEKSLIEGFMTLVQLICPDDLTEGREAFHIPAAEIHDAPAIGFRAIHLCIFPETEPRELYKAVHLAGFLKLTHVVLEFWGTYPFEAMRSLAWQGYAWSREQVAELISLCRSYGMEIIPMFNHLGHAALASVNGGRHAVLDAEPRKALLFEPDGWTWCSSNPDTRKLLADIRAELLEICGPGSYFHLGFDEAYSFATCEKCRQRVHHELLAEQLNALTEELAAHGRRPIIWHDELINREDFKEKTNCKVVANGQKHHTAKAIDLLDRRIIIADWQYHYADGENPTSGYFMEQGFDTILCPWDELENIRSLAANAKDLHAFGVMLTTWDHLNTYLRKMPPAADMLWKQGSELTAVERTESGALLRTLYDAAGRFEEAGWRRREIEG